MVRRRQAQLFARPQLLIDGKPMDVSISPGGLATWVRRPDGTVEEGRLTAEAASTGEAQLKALAPACRECPANPTNSDFGCYGFIPYPIGAAAEEWLLRGAVEGGVAACVAVQALETLGVRTEGARSLRQRSLRGAGFLELPEPLVAAWSLADGSERRLSTDLLLQLALYELPTWGNTALLPLHENRLLPLAAILFGWVSPGEAMTWLRAGGRKLDPGSFKPRAASGQAESALAEYLALLVAAAKNGLSVVADG